MYDSDVNRRNIYVKYLILGLFVFLVDFDILWDKIKKNLKKYYCLCMFFIVIDGVKSFFVVY